MKYYCGKDPSMVCHHCGYKTYHKGNLKYHVLKHHRKEENLTNKHSITLSDCFFHCDTCGRPYKLKTSLREHKRKYCQIGPQFACPHCPYKAKLKGNLRRHIILRHEVL
ncbi:gastrula zinc finger protein XlCGF58.1-like [Diabrotica virgifera virgifera]|uniref:C2H2-type domain-containing protein n=1 Tax=Diabrotica virgifera virgifera TaxID=50390 RepID=A0ABM5JZT8_DIAVI|nr:gastrula zinc finger protein XlCGF58.1-like [Diabrotica virgifera virgifera]